MPPTIEEFVAVLNDQFTKAIQAKPMNAVAGVIEGWSPEQVMEEYRKAVNLTLAHFAGTGP